jgi:predicted nucleic acid-binding protein
LIAGSREFLDSNVLVYAFTTDRRAETVQNLLARGCLVSVQVLNEFANVARSKLAMDWRELREALGAIRTLCRDVIVLDLDTHETALGIAERQNYSIFDSLVISSALRAGCATLWSEDMQHGILIEGQLRIANPFASP